MEEQWINDLRKKMASHQTPVPPGLWEGIESALQKQSAPMTLRKKVLLWTSGAGGIAAAALLAFLLLQEKGVDVVAEDTSVLAQTIEGMEQTTGVSQQDGATQQQWLAQVSPQGTKAAPQKTLSDAEPLAVEKAIGEKENEGFTEEKKEEVTVQSKTEGERTSTPKPFRSAVAAKSTRTMLAKATPRRKARLDLQLFAGNLPHNSDKKSGYGEFVTGTVLPHRNSAEHAQTYAPVRDIIYSNLGEDIQTRKKHKLPLKFGVSARYHLNDRLSLESGLTYTYLASELSSGTDHHYFVTHQRLQYLGVPVSLSYDVWKNKTWNLYVSAGGSLEKCIYGKSATDFVLSRKKVADQEEHVMEKPLQWAVHGAVGAQVNFSSRWGLYIEPGVGYYFDNGSPVETIYKEQPLNFNFKLGVRFSFH